MFRSCALLLMVFVATSRALAADGGPNIVVVLTDDLGYGDLACYGDKELRTPNIDRFASEGLRLTSCYAGHGNCSPSRTALMTGRTPTRVGIRNWIPEDIGETTDLVGSEPEKFQELKAMLEAKYQEVRGESPIWPAWKFTGAEGRKIIWPDYTKKRAAK